MSFEHLFATPMPV